MARPPAVAVACSGGRDSMALLHATVQSARSCGVEVLALHVHHGLMAEADAWQRLVERTCEAWRADGWPVQAAAHRVRGRPSAGDSVEAWARRQRYDGLSALAEAHGVGLVLLAHHRRDQAETFLLQALRGAGVAGLSSMPRETQTGGIRWVRPWLDQPREAIDAYVARHRVPWVDDPSNADHRFQRNRLRSAVWPALTGAFPDAETTLATAARWAQEAAQALAELAQADVALCTSSSGRLDVAAWAAFSPARRSNALRTWLAGATGEPAPASLVERLLVELDQPGSARWACPGGELRRYRQRLGFARSDARGAAAQPAPDAPPPEPSLSITGPGRHDLPGWGGTLVASAVDSGGVPVAWLAHVELRLRREGVDFQAGPGRPPRSLKKQYQAAGVPEWNRRGPLVYSGGQLVFVPHLGLDARVVGLPGQPQLLLDWQPAA